MYHLLSNAVKYSTPHTVILVTVELAPFQSHSLQDYLVTTIRDYGEGYDTSLQGINKYQTF